MGGKYFAGENLLLVFKRESAAWKLSFGNIVLSKIMMRMILHSNEFRAKVKKRGYSPVILGSYWRRGAHARRPRSLEVWTKCPIGQNAQLDKHDVTSP